MWKYGICILNTDNPVRFENYIIDFLTTEI